jgi:hypothetical protein
MCLDHWSTKFAAFENFVDIPSYLTVPGDFPINVVKLIFPSNGSLSAVPITGQEYMLIENVLVGITTPQSASIGVPSANLYFAVPIVYTSAPFCVSISINGEDPSVGQGTDLNVAVIFALLKSAARV